MGADIKHIALNSNTKDTRPFVIMTQGRQGGATIDTWQKIATLPAYNGSRNALSFCLSGSLGGYYRGEQNYIDLVLTNRGLVSGQAGITAVGTYKPKTEMNPTNFQNLEVYDNEGTWELYLHNKGYVVTNLACYVYESQEGVGDTTFSFDYAGFNDFVTEQPGTLIWSLQDNMSPTPDMKRVVDYITNPQNDNYAQQLLPRYDSAPESPIDLNDYMTPGVYKSQNNSQTTQYVINKPAGLASGFILNVYIDKGTLASAEQWRIQELMCHIGVWRRHLDGSTGVWTDWIRTDLNAIQAGTNITKTIDAQGRVVLDATGMTRQQILDTLGYTEIPISKTDENNNTVTVYVLGRTS